ncbi:DUF6520 family protein [Pontibacter indicus]|uniref:Uncharacterized protein n=1 Tax=Pontibacter indicus TaxID=1317125 RepID=A0A1R3XQ87_9BACT|nr:DUF6520 family protein [Pontibacter indicus]SIT94057.1 hypothetical protein SAMN05444128_3417 [Pontibacter indicus]
MKKYMLSLAAMVVAVAAMAFTNVEKPEEQRLAKYIFTGSQLSQATNPDHWDEVPLSAPGCSAGSSLPCAVTTEMNIEDWLAGKTAEQVRLQADSRRN